ncbi:MAG: helix-turn-helix transcriptional regulator [Chloroflexi bacterium]|nr:helix-turn-helix transcriptional regulator [Chloroflexota bacterium]
MAKRRQASSISPEYVILGMLDQKPAHGYDLHERIAQQLGQIWTISLSQVYNLLSRLEGGRLIVGILQEQERAPARHLFTITALGRKHLEDWLVRPTEPSVHAIRVEFLTRLYFVRTATPERVDPLFERQIVRIRDAAARMQAALDRLPDGETLNRWGLDLRIHQLTSVIDWLTRVREEIGQLPSD